jgi:hypothetical protein
MDTDIPWLSGALFLCSFSSRVARGIATGRPMEDTNSGGNSAPAAAAPTSFAEAFASDVSPTSGPVDQSTTPPAAEQPGTVQAESPQQTDDRSPFIPRTRFDEVNTERNTLKQWREQHAWAETPEVQQIVQMIANSKGDPMAFFAQQFADLAQHPTYSQQLRTFLGQQFGGLRQRQQTEQGPQEPQPDVAIYDSNNQEVGRTFSAKALAERDAYREHLLLEKLNKSLAPDLQTLKTIQQERQQAAAEAQAGEFATSLLAEFKSIPGFDEKTHGPVLAAEVAKLQLAPNAHPAVVEAAARKALLQVVLPTLGQRVESKLLDNLQKKAAANSSVNPGSAVPSTPRTVTRFDQLPADAWK